MATPTTLSICLGAAVFALAATSSTTVLIPCDPDVVGASWLEQPFFMQEPTKLLRWRTQSVSAVPCHPIGWLAPFSISSAGHVFLVFMLDIAVFCRHAAAWALQGIEALRQAWPQSASGLLHLSKLRHMRKELAVIRQEANASWARLAVHNSP